MARIGASASVRRPETRRILYVLQSSSGGGPAQALLLAREMTRRGFGVTFARPEASGNAEHGSIDVVALPKVALQRTSMLLRLAAGVDLVHAHGTRAATWALPLLVMRRSVTTFHGLHPLRRAGGERSIAARALIRAVVAASDATICVGFSEAADLKRLDLWRERICVIRNAVPPSRPVTNPERREARKALALANHDFVVLFAARLHEQKDPFTALAVAALAPDSVFLFAGGGDLLPDVSRCATENVRVLGHYDDIRTLLAAADVFLSTARWEGLPLSVLEAMWAGVPVLASDAAGNREAIGDAGIVVAIGDVDAFRSELERLRDPGLRDVLASQGRERVEREFAFERMLDETVGLYEALLGR
jgi:glycosyltransferase involved in cell wall biosynthesis